MNEVPRDLCSYKHNNCIKCETNAQIFHPTPRYKKGTHIQKQISIHFKGIVSLKVNFQKKTLISPNNGLTSVC